jgi:hypothetical protein
MQNDAYRPTIGSTPAMIENAIDSGIRARDTVKPASVSPLIFENHSFLIVSIRMIIHPDGIWITIS